MGHAVCIQNVGAGLLRTVSLAKNIQITGAVKSLVFRDRREQSGCRCYEPAQSNDTPKTSKCRPRTTEGELPDSATQAGTPLTFVGGGIPHR